MIVRRAGDRDFTAVAALCAKVVQTEAPWKKVDPGKLWRALQDIFELGYVLLLEDFEGKIRGMAGLRVEEPVWYSTELALVERWLWVEEAARQEGGAKLLFEGIRALAREKELPVVLTPFDVERLEAKIRLYRTMGAELVGGILRMRG